MAARTSCFEQLGLSHLQRRDLVLENVRVDSTSKLGSGAYGTVYKATWQGVHVAAKVLHEILIDTDVVGEEGRTLKLREFGREVQKLCQLHHPNLTQLLGVAEVDGQPALVVELMKNENEKMAAEANFGTLPIAHFPFEGKATDGHVHVLSALKDAGVPLKELRQVDLHGNPGIAVLTFHVLPSVTPPSTKSWRLVAQLFSYYLEMAVSTP